MSRGVVLWPDEQTDSKIRSIWTKLGASWLSTTATKAHSVPQPHVSLIVADRLDAARTLTNLGETPAAPIPVLIESLGLVPGGHLLLTITATTSLLAEQRRVHGLAKAFAVNAWPHYEPDQWLPHITLARGLTPDQIAEAVSLTLPELPVRGSLVSAGVEDGQTGKRWLSPPPST